MDSEQRLQQAMREVGPLLVMMIGPTGAGKTTWVSRNYSKEKVIASDDIRIEYGEEMGYSPSDLPTLLRAVWNQKEAQVKEEHRNRVRDTLLSKSNVIAEASHVRSRDRIAMANIGHSLGVPVFYIVINRSLEDKHMTAGWRAEFPNLIDKQEKMFMENEADILKGDGHKNTIVLDLRRNNDNP